MSCILGTKGGKQKKNFTIGASIVKVHTTELTKKKLKVAIVHSNRKQMS